MSEKEKVLAGFETEVLNEMKIPPVLTVLPLRDVLIFPNMIFPVLIGRTSTLKAVAEAVETGKYIFVTAQKSSNVDEPEFKDVYRYGVTARIIQVLRLPNNLLKVLVEGLFQSRIKKQVKNKEYLEAEVVRVKADFNPDDKEFHALIRKTENLFTEYIKFEGTMPPDILSAFETIEDPEQKLYFAAANTKAKIESKQEILNEKKLKNQFFKLISILTKEIEMQKLEDEIDSKINDTIQKTQKKFYIQEQIRALQNELDDDDELMPELASIRDMIEKAEMSEEAKNKAGEEFERLKKMPAMSPEFSVNRTFIEWLAQVPWNKTTEDNFDVAHVKQILDEDHYDLEKPKDRILEYIAVLNLSGSLKRQILCFTGPPGVGKTSLAKSIARALGREFVRFSLGGVRDEAEIRGHRRTYIGAMPGKIIQSMKKAGTINPVILLDEVDKMSMDFRGDPSSALLEVLDPEQNSNFNDHYLEVDYDLSNVLFITTANVIYDIPLPLQDRMEIIQLHSYLDPEKLEIAKRHIIPKLIKEFGVENFKIEFTDDALMKIIREHTRESGVRNLEREIASILRKLAKDIVAQYSEKYSGKGELLRENKKFKKEIAKTKFEINPEKVEKYLKTPKFRDRKKELRDKVGVATGLAWTSTGGDILPVEVTIMPSSSEKLTLTGKLGDVMKESATAALSFIRSKSGELDIPEDFSKKKEIHIHVPEGAIPKDGPSAGITMACALISAATGKPLSGKVAMTGEITLRGNILPIGGLKEKLLAAKRMGITKVIIPDENESDLADVDELILSSLEIVKVAHLSDALEHAFS